MSSAPNPLCSAALRSFSAIPRLFLLDLLDARSTGERGLAWIRPYHLLAFDYGDDHQRVRMALEGLAAVAIGDPVPPALRGMVETCMSECPHPSPVAQAVLRLAALGHRLLPADEVGRWFARSTATPEERSSVRAHFYPHQLLGQAPLTPDAEAILRGWVPSFPAGDAARGGWHGLLATWDSGDGPEVPTLCDLALAARGLRTDYLKFRAGEALVSRAVRAGDRDCLELVLDLAWGHLSTRRRKPRSPGMVKRHRRAGLMAATALAFLALGDGTRARQIRHFILAVFVEAEDQGPGEVVATGILEAPRDPNERASALRALIRLVRPGSRGRQDADVEAAVASLHGRCRDTLGSETHRRLRSSFERASVDHPHRPPPSARPFIRPADAFANGRWPSGLGSWIRAIQALESGDPAGASALADDGWDAALRCDPETAYQAAVSVLRSLYADEARDTLRSFLATFADQFRRLRRIPLHPGDALSELGAERRRSVEAAVSTLLSEQGRRSPAYRALHGACVERLLAGLDLGDRVRTWTVGRCLLVQGTRSAVVCKRDPGSFEAQTLRVLREALGAAIPTVRRADHEVCIYEFRPGTPLTDLAGAGRLECLRQTARALAALHACRPDLPSWFVPTTERSLRALGPPLGEQDLAEALRREGTLPEAECDAAARQMFEDYLGLPNPDPARAVIVHGDLHPDHIVHPDAGSSLTIVDWEDTGLGWREEDLGWLFAGLSKKERERFLPEYLRCAGGVEISPEAVATVMRQRDAYNRVWTLVYRHFEAGVA